jgi:rRNA maturation endonuclease Nob1
MIQLDFVAVLAVFVSFPLVVIGILALFYNFRSIHRSMRKRESIYECSDCGHVYAFARNRPMDRCPRCGHLNEALRS